MNCKRARGREAAECELDPRIVQCSRNKQLVQRHDEVIKSQKHLNKVDNQGGPEGSSLRNTGRLRHVFRASGNSAYTSLQ